MTPKKMNTEKKTGETENRVALNALIAELGSCVRMDRESRFSASLDNLRLSSLPHAVIRVGEASQVAQVLRLATQYKVPVTSRGAGSSPTGSAVPIRAGWVLDLSKLNSIKIDPVARIAKVGAGVITADLQERVDVLGLFYPPDPSSGKYSTIGGNIACNAGGMRCVKYGVTRDYVLGLSGYLSDGNPFEFGLPLKKYVSGLNLRDLLIGSEGMLGVVTSASLKLIPKPEKRRMGLFAFKNETVALEKAIGLFKNGINPSILEFLDRQSVACAEKYTGQSIVAGYSEPSILLLELDGSGTEIDRQYQKLSDYMGHSALSTRIAETSAEAEELRQVRRTCSQSMFTLADTKLNEDVVVPIEKQLELVRYTIELNREIGLATPTFGHAGDGNLHVHIMYNRSNPNEVERAWFGIKKLMRKVVDLGGSITGEHGIGLAKTPFMSMQHSPAEIAAMRSVKEALDPYGILNPGKMFEPFDLRDHDFVEVDLPWDHQ